MEENESVNKFQSIFSSAIPENEGSSETTQEETQENSDDQENEQGVQSDLGEGQESEQEQSNEEGSGEEASSSGVVQEASKTEEEVEPVKVKKQVKVSYKDFIEQNKDSIYKYLKDSSTDYSSLDNLEAIKLQLKAENPEWNDKLINDELEDRYGLNLKELDPEELSSEEKALLNKAERLILKHGSEAKKFLSENKVTDSILPEFEYEFEEDETAPEVVGMTPEQYQDELIKSVEEHKEKVWIPALKKTINEQIESITEDVEYELNGNKGVIKVNYKLSDDERKEILNDLSGYIAQESDNKYVNERGEVDYKGFVEDKAKLKIYSKLMKSAVKEAMALAKENVIKNNIVNFSEEVRTQDVADHKDDYDNFMSKWKGKK